MSKIYRFITWNCNLSLGRKLDLLLSLKPDLAIVQECEESLSVPEGYHFMWLGNNPRKGLGVLARQQIVPDPLFEIEWTYFLPISIPAWDIRILAVWAYNHRAERFGEGRVGSPLTVLDLLSNWLKESRSIVAGDFNNSIVWDKPRGTMNFRDIDEKLSSFGLHSAYHSKTSEMLGFESRSTFFHTKNSAKPYHIDYCYVHQSISIQNVFLPDFIGWRAASDHIPVVIDISVDRN